MGIQHLTWRLFFAVLSVLVLASFATILTLYPYMHHLVWLPIISGTPILFGLLFPNYIPHLVFFLLPLFGFLSPAYKMSPLPLIAPVFLWGLFGQGLATLLDHSHHHRKYNVSDIWNKKITIALPFPIWLFIFYLFFSMAMSLISFLPYYPHLNAIVSRAPWGELPLKNALGWILLAFLGSTSGIFFYGWLANNKISNKFIYSLLGSLMAGVALSSIVGILQWSGHDELAGVYPFLNRGYARFNATFSHPNTLGFVTALLLPLWPGWAMTPPRRLIPWLMGPILLFLMILSNSRSAILITGISFLLLSLLATKKARIYILSALILVILAGSFLLMKNKNLKSQARIGRFIHQVVQVSRGDMPPKSLLGDRAHLWESGWVVFRHHPILGVGLGNYLIKLPNYKNELSHLVNDNCGNMYLHTAAEQGSVGLILFLLILISQIKAYLSRIHEASLLEKGAFAAVLALTISFFFGANLLSFEINLVFWFLLYLISHVQKR